MRLASAIRCMLALLLTSMWAGVAGAQLAHAQAGPAPEGAVKVAFLYNFAQFVEWPPDVLGPGETDFVLCIGGADPFEGAIESLRGKQVNGRTIVWRTEAEIARAEQCHILFLGPGQGAKPSLKAAQKRGVLTVGNEPGFAHAGGVINLVRQDTRFRFEVNLQAANRAGLKLSSQLLRLATIVPGE